MPVLAKNKSAFFAYNILERIEAGLVLNGNETKAVRSGQANLKGAYIGFDTKGATLKGANISKYKFATVEEYNPTRTRRLLLHKKQIDYLRGKSQESGLTIVPLSLYTKGRRIKLEIGLAKGKKQYDKRADIKAREHKREKARALKGEF